MMSGKGRGKASQVAWPGYVGLHASAFVRRAASVGELPSWRCLRGGKCVDERAGEWAVNTRAVAGGKSWVWF